MLVEIEVVADDSEAPEDTIAEISVDMEQLGTLLASVIGGSDGG